MRILLLTIRYPPTLSSAARLFNELAETLQTKGHQVTVLTTIPERYLAEKEAHERRLFPKEEVSNGVDVHRLPPLSLPKHLPMCRAVEHVFAAVQYLFRGRCLPCQDVIIVYSPPLPLAISGILLARRWRGQAIINIQDLYPQSVVDLGLLKNRFLIAFARWMERWVYRHANAVTVHSDGNRVYIAKHGGAWGKVHVVPNWIDLAKYKPGPRVNSFRSNYGLDDAFVVSYAGIMGFAQGVGDILRAAAELEKEMPDFLLVLAGSGVELSKLKQLAQEQGLKKVRFLPHLPEQDYIELLQASDVCLVTLLKSLRTPVVPGKLPCIMAIGRPVVCSVPSTSDARKITEESESGVWVSAGDTEALTSAILELYANPGKREKMGRNGRAYSEAHFDREHCVQQYVELLGDSSTS